MFVPGSAKSQVCLMCLRLWFDARPPVCLMCMRLWFGAVCLMCLRLWFDARPPVCFPVAARYTRVCYIYRVGSHSHSCGRIPLLARGNAVDDAPRNNSFITPPLNQRRGFCFVALRIRVTIWPCAGHQTCLGVAEHTFDNIMTAVGRNEWEVWNTFVCNQRPSIIVASKH